MRHVCNGTKRHETESSVYVHEIGMYHWHVYWHESSIGMNMACINGMNWHETHSGVLGIGVGGTGGMNMG